MAPAVLAFRGWSHWNKGREARQGGTEYQAQSQQEPCHLYTILNENNVLWTKRRDQIVLF